MQGLGAIDLLNKGVGGYNPIGDYNKTLSVERLNLKDLNDFSKINQFNDPKILQGQIQINMPENIDSISDKELVSDLKEVMGNNAQRQNGINTSTPNDLYKSFEHALNDGMDKLNNTQKTAEKDMETFATGGNIDVHTVMLSAEKANLSMQLALQLKTKIIGAYKELSKIQI